MKKKNETTFERIMASPKRKAAFDKGYEEFIISEFLIDAMKEENTSAFIGCASLQNKI